MVHRTYAIVQLVEASTLISQSDQRHLHRTNTFVTTPNARVNGDGGPVGEASWADADTAWVARPSCFAVGGALACFHGIMESGDGTCQTRALAVAGGCVEEEPACAQWAEVAGNKTVQRTVLRMMRA